MWVGCFYAGDFWCVSAKYNKNVPPNSFDSSKKETSNKKMFNIQQNKKETRESLLLYVSAMTERLV